MSLASAIAAGILAERPRIEQAECMSCGRSVDAVKAKLGGRSRFCSDRCLAYFDAGWDARRGPEWMLPASGSKTAAVLPRSASGRSKSEAQKQRRKAERKAALAESWKRYKAKQRATAQEAS